LFPALVVSQTQPAGVGPVWARAVSWQMFLERPAILQSLFRSMASDPDKAKRFAERQAWYDADAGRTTDRELVELVERGGARH
jgi:hypothetical protein